MNTALHEKVVKTLALCADEADIGCNKCTYKKSAYLCNQQQLLKDALMLITEMKGIIDGAERAPIPGKKDKNGKQICLGDILCFIDDTNATEYLLVYYNEKIASFCFQSSISSLPVDMEFVEDLEIIGNRFDNPELLANFTVQASASEREGS